MRKFKILGLSLLLLALALPVTAQISSSTGAIQGTITDPQGGAIVGAKITLVNVGTGARAETTTNAEGGFVFPLLTPGNYRIEVQSDGFRRTVLSDIKVEVTKITQTTAALEIGTVESEIVVSASTQIVDTANATTGDVITGEMVRNIPLPTRNFLDLTALQAGVAAPLSNPAAVGRGAPQLFVAGQRGTVNNFVLNGIDANNVSNNNLGNVPVPNPDAVQEFRVSTSSYDASQGRGSGGNINVNIRGGTNEYHGNLFWFYRSDAFNANDFFFNAAGRPKPVLLQNQFGGTVGGPVPYLDQTFWFFSYQGMRQKNGVAGAVSGNQPVLPAIRSAANLGAAFGINPATIDPVSLAWLNLTGPYDGFVIPSGSCAGVAGCSGPGNIGRFAFSQPTFFNEDQYSASFDRQLWSANKLAIRFFNAGVGQFNPTGGGTQLGLGQANPQSQWHAAAIDTHTFGSTLLNEFRAGLTIVKNKTIPTEVTLDQIGMSRFNSAFFNGVPGVFSGVGDFMSFGLNTNNDQASQVMTYQFADILSWTRGKHIIRTGFEFRRYWVNQFNNFASRGALVPLNFVDFLQGGAVQTFIGSGITDRGFRAWDLSGFIQDDYRITPRLTLNLGLRYDLMTPSVDIRDRLGNFEADRISPSCRATGGNCLGAGFISPAGLGGGFGTPGVSSSTLFSNDYNNIAPRLGLAWDVFGTGKLAVRAGYGIYYIRTSNQTLLQLLTAAPFFQLSNLSNNAGVIPDGSYASPFPTNLPVPTDFPILPIFPQFNGFSATGAPLFINPADGTPANLITVNPFDRNLRTPYNQNYNLTVQFEPFRDWVVEAGFIGARGVKLLAGRNINQARLVNASNPGLGGLTVNSSANVNARVLIPGFSALGLNAVTGSGASWYNAMILSVRHPFRKGLLLKADYTFSKSLDTNSGAAAQDLGNSGGNQLVPDLNRGPSIFDQRHRVVITYLYELPGPKTGMLGQFLGGWSVSGTTIFQSGFPVTVLSNAATLAGLGTGVSYANLAPCTGGFTTGGNVSDNLNNYINTSCFALPPTLANGTVLTGLDPTFAVGGQTYIIGSMNGAGVLIPGTGSLFGDAGRGILRAPFQHRWDMAIIKKFPTSFITETSNVEFRAEFFKLFNTPVFAAPAANAASAATFGRISATTDNTGRVIQFGLKWNF